jgi:ribonuclease R
MAAPRDVDLFRTQALAYLAAHPDRAYRPHEIAKAMGVNNHGRYQALLTAVEALRDGGEVDVEKGRLRHKQPHAATGLGSLTVTAQGFGFVKLDEGGPDVYVRASRMRTALHGDRVRVALAAATRGRPDPEDRREGEIVEVVERARQQTVGTFTTSGAAGWVTPDDQRITHDVYVPRDEWNGATAGDKVVVSIDRFDDPKAAPEGRVLSNLGRADAPGVDVLALAMALGVRSDFPAEVEAEAERIPPGVPAAEAERRLDLRAYPIYTIDPEDAKDFDDAIHTRDLGDGRIEVGVHIADVSHYVREGTMLDAEAYTRATSTYLVDRVIPMLPEALSNGVCSLRPHEDKLTYSCLMTVEPDGSVSDYTIAETVIHSVHRFSYEGAQAVLDGGVPENVKAPMTARTLTDEVLRAGRLAEVLTAKRLREGAIDFDVPEVRVRLDAEGVPVEVVTKERRPANRLIEEFMLLANRAVAEWASSRDKALVYRVHDQPDRERITALADYVRPFGHTLKHREGAIERTALNNLLREIKGSPEAPVIEQAAVRAMAKAVYSPHNIGHFGLGFADYAHFTSPIRRYPDLIAHRLLKRYHAGAPSADEETLEVQAKHCSDREREATEAERESVRMKQVEYAAQHVGDSFDGVVVGATKFGVFVQLTSLMVEGLVHVREMEGDFWEYDPKRYALVGRSSGRRIRVGDACRVRLVAADVASRRVELVFETWPGGESAEARPVRTGSDKAVRTKAKGRKPTRKKR